MPGVSSRVTIALAFALAFAALPGCCGPSARELAHAPLLALLLAALLALPGRRSSVRPPALAIALVLAGCDEPIGREPAPQQAPAPEQPEPEDQPEPEPEQPDEPDEPDEPELLDLGTEPEPELEPEPEPEPPELGPPCTEHEECADLTGPCGSGKCGVSGCEFWPYADGVECAPADLCMAIGACAAGECIGAAPVDCSSLDGPCSSGQCDPLTGECEVVPIDC